MTAENLRLDYEYIFHSKSGIVVFKGRVEEITEKTLLIKDLDSSFKRRLTKEDFDRGWNVLEGLPIPELPF
jgi:hypothetical protein